MYRYGNKCAFWLSMAISTANLQAFKGRIFSMAGKKVTVASSEGSNLKSGQNLFVSRSGKPVGKITVTQVFHTKVEATVSNGNIALNDVVSDKKPELPIFKENSAANEALLNAGTPAEIQAAIAAGADVNHIYIATHDFYGGAVQDAPLWHQIQNKNTELVAVLLKAGSDPNLVDNDGCNSMRMAQEVNMFTDGQGKPVSFPADSEEAKASAELQSLLSAAGGLPPSQQCLNKREAKKKRAFPPK